MRPRCFAAEQLTTHREGEGGHTHNPPPRGGEGWHTHWWGCWGGEDPYPSVGGEGGSNPRSYMPEARAQGHVLGAFGRYLGVFP